jgi:hypothetical protein
MIKDGATHSKLDKLNSAGTETNPGDSRKHDNKSNRVAVELETDWLWEEHRTHERAFRRSES